MLLLHAKQIFTLLDFLFVLKANIFIQNGQVLHIKKCENLSHLKPWHGILDSQNFDVTFVPKSFGIERAYQSSVRSSAYMKIVFSVALEHLACFSFKTPVHWVYFYSYKQYGIIVWYIFSVRNRETYPHFNNMQYIIVNIYVFQST